jgi:hypothetical protein
MMALTVVLRPDAVAAQQRHDLAGGTSKCTPCSTWLLP